jgi:hypothetical protein
MSENTVLATFTIRNEDGSGYHAGYITTMYRLDGSETDDPRDAAEFVGFIQEGHSVGQWIRFAADEGDEWVRVKLN